MSECKGCGEEIEWIETTNGKKMPCDPGKKMFVTPQGQVMTGYIPHWSTCKNADEFRRKQQNE